MASWEGRKVSAFRVTMADGRQQALETLAGQEYVMHFEPGGTWFILIVEQGKASHAIAGRNIDSFEFAD